MENHCGEIFLQETNHNNSMTLGNFKNWTVNMHTVFENKTLEYDVRTFLPNINKNVFRQDLINQDLEMVWTGLGINAKRALIIGNTYIPPNKIEQLDVLNRFLEAGFNNSHKIAVCYHIHVPKSWHT